MDPYKDNYIGIPYIRILWGFHGDSNGFYESSIRFLNNFYWDSIRNSIRIKKGFRVMLQDFFKDSKTYF